MVCEIHVNSKIGERSNKRADIYEMIVSRTYGRKMLLHVQIFFRKQGWHKS